MIYENYISVHNGIFIFVQNHKNTLKSNFETQRQYINTMYLRAIIFTCDPAVLLGVFNGEEGSGS